MILEYILILVFIVLAAAASILTKKLTVAGGVAGVFIALFVYLAADIAGLLMLAVFFVSASLATSTGRMKKERLGIAEHDKGRRDVWQVLSNGGVPALLGFLSLLEVAHTEWYILMIAAALSSAAADTVSSELGSLYGSRFYNILSFRPDKKGLDGVISLEGTVAGIAASLLIALIYTVFHGWSTDLVLIIIAGTIGNLVDSLLGATMERRGLIGNNAVNFLNTLSASLVMLLFILLMNK